MNRASHDDSGNAQLEWWLGIAEFTTDGIARVAGGAERIHLEIADETFSVLDRVPVVRRLSAVVQTTHHGIARLCYRSVGFGSMLVNRACRAGGSL